MTTPAPPCSEQVETWLKARGVKFTGCQPLDMAQINEKASRNNQARADSIHPETVDRYAQALRNGDTFPPIVVMPRGDGYEIVDGNHRHAAHKRIGAATIPAYIIGKDTPGEIVALLVAEANTKHGDPTPTAWRQQQALYLMALGHAAETVAEALGLSASQIKQAIRLAKADNRAKKLGIPGWLNLAASPRERLSTIKLDEVMVAAARVVIDTKWGQNADLSRFVSNINNHGSEAAQMTYIQEVARERAELLANQAATGRKAKSRSIANPKMQVVTALGSVMAIDPAQVPRLFITDTERKEIAQRCEAAAERLLEMEQALRLVNDGS